MDDKKPQAARTPRDNELVSEPKMISKQEFEKLVKEHKHPPEDRTSRHPTKAEDRR
jgi:hypothetical protein